MAKEYGVPLRVVMEFASVLGNDEDFDGLISEIEDYEDQMEDEEE